MTDISHNVAMETNGGAELSRSLKSRHVSMIAIGGIIGAGLFVGSSTTISQAGPAAVFSFAIAGFIILLVMRMISEMAIAVDGAIVQAQYSEDPALALRALQFTVDQLNHKA